MHMINLYTIKLPSQGMSLAISLELTILTNLTLPPLSQDDHPWAVTNEALIAKKNYPI